MITKTPEIFKSSSKLLAFFTTKANNNLAFHVGDDTSFVEIHHEVLACQNQYDPHALVFMNQIHSNKVQIINDEDFNTPPKCDALITNKRNKPLMVMVADCAPILLYDPKKQVIAVAHAGRMGAFNNIVTQTINSMQENFSSKPKDILVSIGAKIGVCCYEVGEDIANEAKSLGFDYAISSVENRYYLDINTILQKQLLACGIVAEHLEIDTTCTACNTDTYYSYRAEGMTGRFAGVMMLR